MAADINKVIETLDKSAEWFDGVLKKTEKKLFDESVVLLKDLDLTPDGKVKTSIANLKKIASIKSKLTKLAKGKDYLQSVSEIAKIFDELQKQQNAYFASEFPSNTLAENYKDKRALMKQIATNNTIEALTGAGLQENVTSKLNDILLRAVTSSEKFSDLQEEFRKHLMGEDGGTGALTQYAGTYSVTAMSQFTRQNNKLLTQDLGLEWFMYVGSNIETTREFCQHLTKKRYIHISELPDILRGKIDGHQCAIYKKTGLPYGMIDGTTEETLQVNCGGWNCRHQLVPVHELAVPEEIRNRINSEEDTQEHVHYEDLNATEQLKFDDDILTIELLDTDLLYACEKYKIETSWYTKIITEVKSKKQYWRIDEIYSSRDRMESQLMTTIADYKKKALKAIDEYREAGKGAEKWIGDECDRILKFALSDMADEEKQRYPIYVSITNAAAKGGALDSTKLKSAIDKAKKDYSNAIAEANSFINKHNAEVNVATLRNYVDQKLTKSRNAVLVTKDIELEIKNLELMLSRASGGKLFDVYNLCETSGIDYNEVQMHDEKIGEKDIIKRISGGDKTGGSCSSVAFAFAANMGGMNVLDFRGGKSQEFFSGSINIMSIAKKVGGKIARNYSDFQNAYELLDSVEEGKYYYFTCGKHAAIIRQNEGVYEYLELQSPEESRNTWHMLSQGKLKSRFGAQEEHIGIFGIKVSMRDCLIDIDLLIKDLGFKTLMGYINTADNNQMKGDTGRVK